MAGLLDEIFGTDPSGPKAQAMNALAAGLMSNNPGMGFVNANQAFAQAPQDALKRQLLMLQAQQAQQGVQRGTYELDEYRRKLADEDSGRQVAAEFFKSRNMPQAGGPIGMPNDGPAGVGASPAMPQSQQVIPPKSDTYQTYRSLADAYSAKGLTGKAQQYYELAEKYRPKYSTTPQVVTDPATGKLINALIAEDGSIQPMQYGVKPNIKLQALGDRVMAIDENTVGNNQSFAMGQSPDSKASNAVTMRGQNMTDARSREANNAALSKPFEVTGPEGGPVLVQQDRNGRITPVAGFQPKGMGATKLTEDQGKATGWLVQADNAWKNMREAIKQNPSAAEPGFNDALSEVPGMGGVANYMRGDTRQKFMQGSSSLSEALLRAATGAGVNQQEAAQKIREITPVYGDSEAVVKQKMDSIPLYLESLKVRAGPGAPKAAAISASAPTMRFNPASGKIEAVR